MATTSDSGPTREQFDRLLAALDSDPNRAGENYESLRQRLITHLRIHGFHELDDLDDLVDKSFDITARRLGDTRIDNLPAFVAGVARNLCREALKKRPKFHPLDNIPDLPQAESPERELAERAQKCLDKCMRRLSDDDHGLILGYYAYSPGEKASSRARLAQSRGSSGTALRVKAHRLREKLEDCVRNCMERAPAE